MKVSTLVLLAGTALAADRPMNVSMCDYYTMALLKNNTAMNQMTVLTALVNTVVLGNAMPKPKIPGANFPASVDGLDGILAPNATYMGQGANLLPYFDGGLASSNRGGSSGVAVNFLDDGGATPLTMFKPANGTSSSQYKLLTHLYQFFGSLLNCTMQGSDAFPSYEGQASMYEVHKFMALNSSQVGYFISQVGLAAKSFGVTDADVTAVGNALTSIFDVKCAAAMPVIPAQGPQLQSICITSDCKQAMNATCDKYEAVMMPGVSNKTLAMGEGNSSNTATASATGSMATGSGSSSGSSGGSSGGSSSGSPSGSSGASPSPSAGAGSINVGSVLAAGGFAAFAFLL